jgi:hypothetical protein
MDDVEIDRYMYTQYRGCIIFRQKKKKNKKEGGGSRQ